jgi:hypothetical protein
MDKEYKLPGPRFLDVHWRGWISCFGSFCIYFVLGVEYVWGFIGQRVISHFHYMGDKGVMEMDATSVIPHALFV